MNLILSRKESIQTTLQYDVLGQIVNVKVKTKKSMRDSLPAIVECFASIAAWFVQWFQDSTVAPKALSVQTNKVRQNAKIQQKGYPETKF